MKKKIDNFFLGDFGNLYKNLFETAPEIIYCINKHGDQKYSKILKNWKLQRKSNFRKLRKF